MPTPRRIARGGRRRSLLRATLAAALAVCGGTREAAALTPSQVLVLYNARGPDGDGDAVADSVEVFNAYAAAYPGVIGFDLDDPAVQSTVVTQGQYEALIRDPVRSFLNDTIPGGNGQGRDLSSQVVVILLTQGLPVRIDDVDFPGIGDDTSADPPSALSEFGAGDATYATVDSELTLLWQAGAAGEAGGPLDAPFIDNAVLNPYHASSARITDFDRSDITEPLDTDPVPASFSIVSELDDEGASPFEFDDTPADPGRIYLTARLAGATVDDAIALIDRAQGVVYNRLVDRIVIDENAAGVLDAAALSLPGAAPETDPAFQGDDYDDAAAALVAAGYDALSFDDDGATQLVGETTGAFTGSTATTVTPGAVAALVTYGGNHNPGGGDNRGFLGTFATQPIDGAIYLSAESFAGRPIDGGPGFQDQADVLDWVAAGGTFAIASAAEPLAFSLPDAEFVVQNFVLGDLTWVEAAWTAIPYLSWQYVVLGDPLATAKVVAILPAEEVTLALVPCIGFTGEVGVAYEVVRIDGEGPGGVIVATVEGTGEPSFVVDEAAAGLPSPRKYVVRPAGAF